MPKSNPSKAEIVCVSLDDVDRNPFRRLADYPFVESKLKALKRSYQEVGMWPGGVIARKVENRYQIAFGHHRVEAATQAGLGSIFLTVMDLTNKQMLGYMGRENLEDFNTNILTMLETWEAGLAFVASSASPRSAAGVDLLEVATLLGWTRIDKSKKGIGSLRFTDTAEACAAASELISGGYIKRDVLAGLSVTTAREICGEARKNINRLAEMGQQINRPDKEVAEAQKQVGKAAASTAEESRKGRVAKTDLRGTLNVTAYHLAKKKQKEGKLPLFAIFAKSLAKQIARWNNSDTVKRRVDEMVKELPNLIMIEDLQAVDRVVFELEHAGKRNADSIKRLTATPASVVRLRSFEGGKA